MNSTRPAYETKGQRLWRYALWWFAGMVLVFLIAPIRVIVPLSFSAGSFLHFPLPGLSLRWYDDFFTSELWLPALKNSLIVGTGATLIATTLGTLAAFGFWRARFPLRRLLFGFLLAPLVVPVIIVAVGVYFAFAKVGLVDGLPGTDAGARRARHAVRAGDCVGVPSNCGRGGLHEDWTYREERPVIAQSAKRPGCADDAWQRAKTAGPDSEQFQSLTQSRWSRCGVSRPSTVGGGR